jgi:hypothetical protein
MRLKVHCITHGRYFKAGEDVPDPPASFAKYAVSEDALPQSAKGALALKGNGTHVKRGARWAKLGDVELEPGEPTYRRKGKAFIRAGRVEP